MIVYDPAATNRPLCIPEGVARNEGWNATPPARCRRNCNPGNLNFEPWQEQFGAVLERIPPGVKETPRFAVFPDVPSGFAALVHVAGFPLYKGKSLAHFAAVWAPPTDDNNTTAYLANLVAWCGIPADAIIDGYLEPPAVSS